jgi:hypothetical protein
MGRAEEKQLFLVGFSEYKPETMYVKIVDV